MPQSDLPDHDCIFNLSERLRVIEDHVEYLLTKNKGENKQEATFCKDGTNKHSWEH